MQRAYSETDGDRDTANTDFKRQKTDDGDDDGFGKVLFKDDFDEEEQVALQLRGLEWQATFDDITNFFNGHKILDKSIVFGKSDEGRKTGRAAILFESEDDAQKPKTT
eukprot:UN15280